MELFKNTWWGDTVLKKIAFHKGANHAKKAADGSHLQSIFSCIVLVLSFQWLHRHIVFEWLMHCGGGKYTYFFLQKLTIKISNSFVHSYDWQFWWGKHTVPVVDRFSLGLNLFSGTNHVLVSISHGISSSMAFRSEVFWKRSPFPLYKILLNTSIFTLHSTQHKGPWAA